MIPKVWSFLSRVVSTPSLRSVGVNVMDVRYAVNQSDAVEECTRLLVRVTKQYNLVPANGR